MVEQHYRWDFIGLSTDTKPTPETSEKVVDGSTFYCSDTSKLYVYCKNNWYEKTVSGGGGTSYTAGTGIDITGNEISVDTDTIQPKLTAGTGIDITDNTISATGGGGGGVTELTSDDYNFPVDNPTSVNLSLLPYGIYHANNGVKVIVAQGQNTLSSSSTYIVGEPSTSTPNTIAIYRISNYTTGITMYEVNTSNLLVTTKRVLTDGNVVQTTGASTTNFMSQKATTDMIFNGDNIQIGNQAVTGASNTVAIGYKAKASNFNYSTALGASSTATGQASIAFPGGNADTQGIMEVGLNASAGWATYGYNNTAYRLVSGVYDGQSAHDAVTVGQVNGVIDAINAALSTNISHIGA